MTAQINTDGQPAAPLTPALIHGNSGNWAPRIGFAWQPNIKPKTVVRAGYSIFYNESIYDSLAQKYLAYQPPFDESQNWYTSASQLLTLQQGFPGQAQSSAEILNTGGVSPFYKVGYAQTWMMGTETSFSQNWILDLTYTGTKGTDLDLLRAPNRAPLGTSQLDTQAALQIPYATSFYYDQSGANSMVVQQDGNYAAERGLSSFDMRHQFRLFSVYELPFGERSRWANHGWKEHALGNWRLLNIVTLAHRHPPHGIAWRKRGQQFQHGFEFFRTRRPDCQPDPRDLRRLGSGLFQRNCFRGGSSGPVRR